MVSPTVHLQAAISPDGAVLFDNKHGQIVRLNATGGFVWSRLRDGKSPNEITRELSEKSGGDFTRTGDDVSAFVEQLRQQNLLPD